MPFAIWRALAGVAAGVILSKKHGKSEAENAFVSGDWRGFRWCTVEIFSQGIVVPVCDGAYLKNVMKKLGGTEWADLGEFR